MSYFFVGPTELGKAAYFLLYVISTHSERAKIITNGWNQRI